MGVIMTKSETPLKARDLLNYPLAVTYPTHGVRQLLDVLEFAEKVRFDPVMTTNSIATVPLLSRVDIGATSAQAMGPAVTPNAITGWTSATFSTTLAGSRCWVRPRSNSRRR